MEFDDLSDKDPGERQDENSDDDMSMGYYSLSNTSRLLSYYAGPSSNSLFSTGQETAPRDDSDLISSNNATPEAFAKQAEFWSQYSWYYRSLNYACYLGALLSNSLYRAVYGRHCIPAADWGEFSDGIDHYHGYEFGVTREDFRDNVSIFAKFGGFSCDEAIQMVQRYDVCMNLLERMQGIRSPELLRDLLEFAREELAISSKRLMPLFRLISIAEAKGWIAPNLEHDNRCEFYSVADLSSFADPIGHADLTLFTHAIDGTIGRHLRLERAVSFFEDYCTHYCAGTLLEFIKSRPINPRVPVFIPNEYQRSEAEKEREITFFSKALSEILSSKNCRMSKTQEGDYLIKDLLEFHSGWGSFEAGEFVYCELMGRYTGPDWDPLLECGSNFKKFCRLLSPEVVIETLLDGVNITLLPDPYAEVDQHTENINQDPELVALEQSCCFDSSDRIGAERVPGFDDDNLDEVMLNDRFQLKIANANELLSKILDQILF